MKQKKIAIVQKLIPHYRIDFFKKICEQSKNQVMVFHSTEISSDGLAESGEFVFPNQKIHKFAHRYFFYQCIVKKLLSGKFDLIVMGPELRIFSNTLVWLLSFFTRSKIVWWTHGFNLHIQNKGFSFVVDRVFKTLMMKKCHNILLYNDYRIDELVAWGIDPEKMIVLNNAINEKPYQLALKKVNRECIDRIETATRSSNHTLLFIGRLTQSKRADLVIELAEKLVTSLPDLRVFIIGEGKERPKLELKTKKMGLSENIFFLGSINNPDELSGYMTLTDFSILPGAVGLSIVHSMICGLPLVTLQDSPHNPEISYLRDNYNGFAANGLKEMKDWIIEQFENPSKIREMKENCLRMIETDVNLDHMVSQFLKGIE
jgi:glycosyltransferase involved in cell wall biosynthesis